MPHLWVKLNPPNGLRNVAEPSKMNIARGANHLEALTNGLDGVSVGHPNLRARINAQKKRILTIQVSQVGTTIFPRIRRLHLASVQSGQILCTVTHAQNRYLAKASSQIWTGCLFIPNTVRRSAQNDAAYIHRQRCKGVPWNDF